MLLETDKPPEGLVQKNAVNFTCLSHLSEPPEAAAFGWKSKAFLVAF